MPKRNFYYSPHPFSDIIFHIDIDLLTRGGGCSLSSFQRGAVFRRTILAIYQRSSVVLTSQASFYNYDKKYQDLTVIYATELKKIRYFKRALTDDL